MQPEGPGYPSTAVCRSLLVPLVTSRWKSVAALVFTLKNCKSEAAHCGADSPEAFLILNFLIVACFLDSFYIFLGVFD